MDKYICRMRREALGREIGEGALAFISGAQSRARNSDVHYPFRQESNMLYLSGFNEPNTLLVIQGGATPRSIFFCAPKDPVQEMWTGKHYGPEEALLQFGFDETHANTPAVDVIARIATLLSSSRHVYIPSSSDGRSSLALLHEIIETHQKNSPNTKFSSLGRVLDERRVIKDEHELDLMRKACMISAIAHRNILRLVHHGMNECELEAEITHRFRKAGGDPLHAYPPIVAAGLHACTLHYTKNNAVMNDGDLVLVDAGCEIEGYASDITRTFPLNGKFSPAQHELYALVLVAQYAAIEKAQSGNALHAVHKAAVSVITRGLIALGLIKGPHKSAVATKAYKRFFPHGTSHFLGLDVHDVGDYKNNRNNDHLRMLEPGMVITVEPGIYVPPAPDIPEKYWNIGIRIEDDVLITSGKPSVLSIEAPKEIADIEGIMMRDRLPFFR